MTPNSPQETHTLQSLLNLPADFPLETDTPVLTDNTKSIHYVPRTPQEFIAVHLYLPDKFITVVGCQILQECDEYIHYLYPADWFNYIPHNSVVITSKEIRVRFNKKAIHNISKTHIPVGFRRYHYDYWCLNKEELDKFETVIDFNKIINLAAEKSENKVNHINWDDVYDDDILIYNYMANITTHKKILKLLKAILRSQFSFWFNRNAAQDALEDIYFILKKSPSENGVYQTEIEVEFNSLVYFAYVLSNCINDLFLMNDYIPFNNNEKKELEYLVKVFANCRLVK